MKILILSCGTGEGHNSAAKAVYDNLKGKNTECEIRDVLSFKSERAARRAAEVYSIRVHDNLTEDYIYYRN